MKKTTYGQLKTFDVFTYQGTVAVKLHQLLAIWFEQGQPHAFPDEKTFDDLQVIHYDEINLKEYILERVKNINELSRNLRGIILMDSTSNFTEAKNE